MNIFNSLGSNYDLEYILQSFIAIFKKGSEHELKQLLRNKFGGEPVLFYKGREAIQAALEISNLKSDDYVAINGFTCYVVEKAIKNAGLKCEYLDIENDLNFSAETLQKAIFKNKKIKAVIIQNTLGNLSDHKSIKKICDEYNLILIEDLAHTTNSSDSDFTAISFSQDKSIDAVSGGALIIKNKSYLKNITKIKLEKILNTILVKDIFYPVLTFLIRNLYSFEIGKVLHFVFKKLNILSIPIGSQNNKLHILPKWNANMALYYLKKIDQINKHRKDISKIYGKNEANIRYPILVNNRREFINYMKKQGLHISDIWYDHPVGPKKISELSDYKIGMCPNSDKISEQIINLPTHIKVSSSDAFKILDLVKKWQNTK